MKRTQVAVLLLAFLGPLPSSAETRLAAGDERRGDPIVEQPDAYGPHDFDQAPIEVQPVVEHAKEHHGHGSGHGSGHGHGHGHAEAEEHAQGHGHEEDHADGHGHGHEEGHEQQHHHEHGHKAGHGHGHAQGGHAQGGHGNGHGGHHHAPATREARAYSFCVMGAVAFMAALFYLVNYDDVDIKQGTWRTVSMTISIFGAVLLYGMIRACFMDVLVLAGVEITDHVMTALCLSLFFALYALLQVVLFQLRGRDPKLMHGVSEISAHVTGFAAMFGFSGLMRVHPALWWTVVVVGIALATLVSLAFIAGKVRVAVAKRDGREEEDERWEEAVEEAEDDCLSLCLSFLIVAVIRAHVRGQLQPYNPEVEPKDTTGAQCGMLLAGVCSCFGLSLALAFGGARFDSSGSAAKRWLKISKTTFMFASCFGSIFWLDWVIYTLGFDGERIAACLAGALILTSFAIMQLFLVDCIADRIAVGKGQRTLRYIILSLGVLVGFAWEKAFDIAMEDIAHSGALLGMAPGTTTHVLGVLLCAAVLPAWYMYILPKAIEDEPSLAEKEV